uniref:Generative cell specific-1/HAP2 domain-containing protein n=1 Tax=Oryza brachyantha TaxID=4533 RepID=J3M5E4_ORYBR
MAKGKANTAHCLRFPGDWFHVFGIGTRSLGFSITVQVTKRWEVVVGPENKTVVSGDNFLRAKLVGDYAGYTSIPSFEDYYLVTPRKGAGSGQPQDLGNEYSKWMLLERVRFTLDGLECDKIGVCYEAYRNQTNFCSSPFGSCLGNQLSTFWEYDQARIKQSLQPLYVVDGRRSKDLNSNLLVELSADDIEYIHQRSPARISDFRVTTFEALSQDGTANVTTKNIGKLESSYILTLNCSSGINLVEEINALGFENVSYFVSIVRRMGLGVSPVNGWRAATAGPETPKPEREGRSGPKRRVALAIGPERVAMSGRRRGRGAPDPLGVWLGHHGTHYAAGTTSALNNRIYYSEKKPKARGAAILKASDFSELDRAEYQFSTAPTVYNNGAQIVGSSDDHKKSSIRDFFGTVIGFFTGKFCRATCSSPFDFSCHIRYICIGWILMIPLLLVTLFIVCSLFCIGLHLQWSCGFCTREASWTRCTTGGRICGGWSRATTPRATRGTRKGRTTTTITGTGTGTATANNTTTTITIRGAGTNTCRRGRRKKEATGTGTSTRW